MYYAVQNCPVEIFFCSGKVYDDPFNEVELDVIFQGPNSSKQVVPAFWAGENVWKMRFSTPVTGRHSYTTVCSDRENTALNNQKGEVEVNPYQGSNPLLKHGPLRVSDNHGYLEHTDGTPFFWLGEIWIFGLCKRLAWPQDFRTLTEDRVRKGFTVITLTAGLYPPALLNERDANEAGLPWNQNYTCINPFYFNMADLRIEHLVNAGLLPMIYGSWSYALEAMGVSKLKKHWRYLIARYGAYPVVWCLAGEALQTREYDYDRKTDKTKEIEIWRRKEWTELARYIKQIDPYHHPLTVHPPGMEHSRSQVEDPSLLDFDYLQTAHGDWFIIADHVKTVVEAVKRKPKMPVIVGEVCYEGHGGTSWEDMQRFLFWSSILSGTCGHTYGAEGVWQMQTGDGEPLFGRGGVYGTKSWKETYQLPGSKQLGISKRLLERYPWWQLEPHPEWVKSCWYFQPGDKHAWKRDKYYTCYAAGIPKKLRIIYFPVQRFPQPVIQGLELDVTYQAYYFDPRTGKEYPLGMVKPNPRGDWSPSSPFIFQDGVLVLEQHKNVRENET